jgi:hypothetical protein
MKKLYSIRSQFLQLSAIGLLLIATSFPAVPSLLPDSNAATPKAPAVTYGKAVDLRADILHMGIAVRSQLAGRNTCSVHAMTFLLEFLAGKFEGAKNANLSEEYLNAVTDIVKGAKDDGDFFNNIWAGYQTDGIVNESEFPYKPKYDPNLLPGASLISKGEDNRKYSVSFIRDNDGSWGLNDSHIQGIIKALDSGLPVAVGIKVSSSENLEQKNILGVQTWNRLKNEAAFNGHSVALVGYKQGTAAEGSYFIFRNSYGAAWGVQGYGYLSFDYLKKYTADAVYCFKASRLPDYKLLPHRALIRKPLPLPPDPMAMTKLGAIFKQ